MIKVSVMYPNRPGARFDQAYYLDEHMPMVKARMGPALQFYAVDKGVAGGGAGDPATYLVVAHLHCVLARRLQRRFGPHAPEIIGDIPNYTDQAPVVQISEVLVDQVERPPARGDVPGLIAIAGSLPPQATAIDHAARARADDTVPAG